MWLPNGTNLRTVDFAPRSDVALHRTKCFDYGILVRGELSLTLDGGVERKMQPGDCIAKRGRVQPRS